MRDGDLIFCYYSTRNPISFDIPSLLYLDGGILSVPHENSRGYVDSGIMQTLTRIWSTDWIERSWESDCECFSNCWIIISCVNIIVTYSEFTVLIPLDVRYERQ